MELYSRSMYEKYWLNWLNERNFTTLFVDGNHENFERLWKNVSLKKSILDIIMIIDKLIHNLHYYMKI